MLIDCNLIRNHLFECIKQVSEIRTVVKKETTNNPAANSKRLYNALLAIADVLHIDVVEAVKAKMAANAKKYPIELCKGLIQKYSAYTEETQISKHHGQEIIDNDEIDRHLKTKQNDQQEFHSRIPALTNQAIAFTKERNWDKYDTVENLYFAMNTELAELCEIFQWKGGTVGNNEISNKEWDKAAQEIADVLIYNFKLIQAMAHGW
jgi:NTP pyrophosphatase (non-canonical NTP hydrolase)